MSLKQCLALSCSEKESKYLKSFKCLKLAQSKFIDYSLGYSIHPCIPQLFLHINIIREGLSAMLQSTIERRISSFIESRVQGEHQDILVGFIQGMCIKSVLSNN